MLNEDRERMVATQIEARGITDPLVLDAMRTIPRERFVPVSMARFAYDDGPLPIGKGQTISQPYSTTFLAKPFAAAGLLAAIQSSLAEGSATAGEADSPPLDPGFRSA